MWLQKPKTQLSINLICHSWRKELFAPLYFCGCIKQRNEIGREDGRGKGDKKKKNQYVHNFGSTLKIFENPKDITNDQ